MTLWAISGQRIDNQARAIARDPFLEKLSEIVDLPQVAHATWHTIVAVREGKELIPDQLRAFFPMRLL
jgi:hypothetical protein